MSIEFTFVPGAGKDATAFFFDPTSARRHLARAEEAGFDRVLIDDHGGLLANFDIAAHIAQVSPALQIVLTHWAGVITPVVAARQLAALGARTGGRLALRVLADPESDRDNMLVPHAGHIAIIQRTDEYLMLLKRLWLNSRPFDFEGAFHSFRQGFVPDKGKADGIPFRMSGNSGTSIQMAARLADVFELSPGAVDVVRQQIERVHNAAVQYGRSKKIAFALPVHIGDAGYKRMEPVRNRAANIAVSFLPYIEAGVSEFMVSGVDDDKAMKLFGDVATVLRNSVGRSEAAAIVGWPAIRSHGDAARHRPVATS
jgi:alkanesulfonate monooxygenase